MFIYIIIWHENFSLDFVQLIAINLNVFAPKKKVVTNLLQILLFILNYNINIMPYS